MTDEPGDGFRCTVEVRWGDSDRLGHVNNTKFVEYTQEARLKFMASGGRTFRPCVLATMTMEFTRPIKDEMGPVEVETSVLALGRSSSTLRHVIRANDGALCGSSDVVLVAFDTDTDRSRPWSDDERATLEKYLVSTPTA